MRLRRLIWTTAGLAFVSCVALQAGATAKPAAACGDFLTSRIPQRAPAAPVGSEFVKQVGGLDDDAREIAIRQQFLSGNMPAFLRHLQPVEFHSSTAGRAANVTVCVSPDYLAVGTDKNFFFAPMRLQTALIIAREFRFALPTAKMVDAIYAQARRHLQPRPLPAGDTMRTTSYYWEHNELIAGQRSDLPDSLGLLTAGEKKDLVLTNRLWSYPDRVAIYGWHRLDGSAIQPLSTVHGARYADYSHGVRLVSDTAYVDGEATPLMRVLQDPGLSTLISDEGEIRDPARLVEILSSQPCATDKRARCFGSGERSGVAKVKRVL